MVINFITTEDILDIKEYMRWAYEEICENNKNMISNLQLADKNFLYRSLIKAKRNIINQMAEKSLDCVLTKKYSKNVIDLIQNKGFIEIEDIYPIKASFENGLINIYHEYKIYNKKYENIFKIKYINSEYFTSDEVDFVKIRQYAKKNYILGNYKDALAGFKLLVDVNDEDFEIMIYMGNIYTFFYKDKDKAVESYLKAIKCMKKHENLIKEISQLFYMIGCIYMYSSKFEKAIKYFKEALYVYKDSEYLLKLAQAYCLSGDKASCIKQIETLIEENAFYSLEIQFCFSFYPMKEEIKFLLEEMSSKFIIQYALDIKKGNELIKDIDLYFQLEGAEDIREELLRFRESIISDENDICFIYAYKNLNRARSFRSISQIYSRMYFEGINIKKRIDEGKVRLDNINVSSLLEISNKITSLTEQKKSCKIKIDYYLKAERKFRIWFSVISCFAFLASWTYMHFKPSIGIILLLAWIIMTVSICCLNIFGKNAYIAIDEYETIEKEILNLQHIKAEEWESKRNMEKQIKKDISSMCLNYNDILNISINEVNRSLGLNLGEVKINMI